jgi:hypothetical protein
MKASMKLITIVVTEKHIDTSVMPFLIIKVKERICILDQPKIVIPYQIILLCDDGIVEK